MYYTLTALLRARCGTEIMEFVLELTRGRVHLVPGALYTMPSKFKNENMIRETGPDNRKWFYLITGKGKEMLMQERRRLKAILQDGEV